MADVKKVPPDQLLERLVEEMKKDDRIKVPEWANYLKAGVHRESSWVQTDWYYRRMASILRKVYLKGPVGISRLSEDYGGKVDRGSKGYHPEKGSRYIIRTMFHSLEALGYIKKEKEGRVAAPKGMSLLDKASKDVLKELSEKDEAFKKYL